MTSKIDLNTFAADFEKMRKERDEAQSALSTMETTLEDYHAALSRVLGFVHDFAMEHMDVGDEKALALVKDDIERLHPILSLHRDVQRYGFVLECDVPSDEEGARSCHVCRGDMGPEAEADVTICAECLRTDAEERADAEGGAR